MGFADYIKSPGSQTNDKCNRLPLLPRMGSVLILQIDSSFSLSSWSLFKISLASYLVGHGYLILFLFVISSEDLLIRFDKIDM